MCYHVLKIYVSLKFEFKNHQKMFCFLTIIFNGAKIYLLILQLYIFMEKILNLLL